ncbi:ribosomal protein S18-alanine N-acetyltransferase [Candidatus Poribacteria bacterium]|nr:ribosomal protein S18-alanine N-acetyltransferase [Candidatus Poribacteria bacterium]
MNSTKPIPKIIFQQMEQEDLDKVMAIEREAFPDPWHVSFFKRELRSRKKHTHCYVARIDNIIVGYIVFYVFCGEGHIMNIAVDAEYRRQGVAKYLLSSALEIVSKEAGNEVFLEVGANNTPAKQLYRQFGFKVYGIRKKYYRNGEDAFVLRKDVEYENSQRSTN